MTTLLVKTQQLFSGHTDESTIRVSINIEDASAVGCGQRTSRSHSVKKGIDSIQVLATMSVEGAVEALVVVA